MKGPAYRSGAVALALLLSLGALAPAGHADHDGAGTQAPGERLVVAFEGPVPRGLDRFHGAAVLRTHTDADTLVVRATSTQADAIRADPDVAGVAPDRPVALLGTPNDPKWPQQWGPAAIQAADAWDVTPGKATVRVAVLDTGIDTDHEDRPGALVLGPDVADNDGQPEDVDGHGTWVAGIVGGARDNGRGTAGLANVEVYVIKVFTDGGIGYTSYLDQGIAHAIGAGADIITMSLGFDTHDPMVKTRIESAAQKGILLIAAAGNENGGQVLYPAAYPEVIAVSSVDENLDIAAHSSQGGAVELAAPGVHIKGPWRSGGYAGASGTSGAAPHVAGVAALLWSLAPGVTAQEVRSALATTALDRGPAGRDAQYGHGVVQAYDALTAVFDHIPGQPIGETTTLVIDEGETVPWTVGGVPVGAAGFAWSLDDDDAFDDGGSVTSEWEVPGSGPHEVALRFETRDGTSDVFRRTVTIQNLPPTIHRVTLPGDLATHAVATLSVEATDPADPITYLIDWGDGTTTTTPSGTAEHAWATPGTYTVQVTADDGDGGTDTATRAIRIGDDGSFAPGSLQVRQDNLLPTNLVPLGHPTEYLVDVEVVLQTGGAVNDVRVDFVVRRGGSFFETFATRTVSAPSGGVHTFPLTVPLDLTLQNPGEYRIDVRLDPQRAWSERIETNNVITTVFDHL